MGKRLHDIVHSELVRNSAKLLSANVIAQAIGLVVYPVLTRLYSPEDFGLLNLFLSIGGVLVLLATAEYQYAIVLPKEEKKARGLVRLCMKLLLAMVGITLVSVALSHPIANLFRTPELAHWYWLMPIFVLVMGGWNILNYWYIRRKIYGRISGYQISQSILSAGGKIGFGNAGLLEGGMILSIVVAPLLSLILSVSLAWKRHIHPLLSADSVSTRSIVKEYRNFPIYTLPRSVVNMVAGQLPVLLLTPVFGTEDVGFWSMAILLGFAPISMFTKALYQVLYQHVTMHVNEKKKIGGLFKRFTISTLCLVVPTFIVLYPILPHLTQWLLGREWSVTGEYIRWMLPWLCSSVLTASTSFLADIFFKQRIGLWFEILMAVLRTIGVLFGLWLSSFSVAVAGYAIGSAVAVFTQYVWLLTLVRHYDATIVA